MNLNVLVIVIFTKIAYGFLIAFFTLNKWLDDHMKHRVTLQSPGKETLTSVFLTLRRVVTYVYSIYMI